MHSLGQHSAHFAFFVIAYGTADGIGVHEKAELIGVQLFIREHLLAMRHKTDTVEYGNVFVARANITHSGVYLRKIARRLKIAHILAPNG